MGHAGDDIHHVRMLRQNRRQCPNHVLNSLVGRQQAEGEQNRLAFRAKLVFEIVGVHERQIRHAVRNHIDLSRRNRIHFAQQSGPPTRSSPPADRKAARSLRARCADSGPDRAAPCAAWSPAASSSGAARPECAPGAAAVDAVLMLQTHQIVAVEVEKIRGPLVGCNVFLGQLQAHLFRIFVA